MNFRIKCKYGALACVLSFGTISATALAQGIDRDVDEMCDNVYSYFGGNSPAGYTNSHERAADYASSATAVELRDEITVIQDNILTLFEDLDVGRPSPEAINRSNRARSDLYDNCRQRDVYKQELAARTSPTPTEPVAGGRTVIQGADGKWYLPAFVAGSTVAAFYYVLNDKTEVPTSLTATVATIP